MTPFEEILRRKRQRQPMDERLPDGRSAIDLLNRVPNPFSRAEPSSGGHVLTPQNQQAITRPRTMPSVDDESTYTPSDPNAQRQRAVTFNPATGRPNEDYYRERDDPAGLYNSYQNWTPHGGKRGFKNSLKAGALAAARVAQNTDNPAAILTAFGVGTAGGTVKPDFKNKLVRGFKLDQMGGELANDLKLQKDQAAIDASQMVQITLENGQPVLVPVKSAGTLQSRQQEIGLRGDTLEARKKRWGQLGEHEAATEAQQLYNSGGADDSAELRAEIAKRLRLPAGTVLPPRNAGGQVKLDEFGNYIVVNPRTASVADTGRKSYEPTKQANADTRQRRALESAKERVQMQQQGATQRAGMRGTGATRLDGATKREIAKGVGAVESVKSELADIDARIKQIDEAAKGRAQTPEEIQKLTTLGRQRQQKVNEAKAIAAQLDSLDPNSETGVGEGGYPYRKPRANAPADLDNPISPNQKGRYAGRRISKANVAEYGRRHGMTPEQAEEYLRNEKAIIY